MKFSIVYLLCLVLSLIGSSSCGASRLVDEYLYYGPVPIERQRTVVWLRNKLQSSVHKQEGPSGTYDYLVKLLDGVKRLQKGQRISDDGIADAVIYFNQIGNIVELDRLLEGLIEISDLEDERFCTSHAVKEFIFTFRAINFDRVKGLQELYPAGDYEPSEAPPKLFTYMRHFGPLHHQICWPLFERLFEAATKNAIDSEKQFDALMMKELASSGENLVSDATRFEPHRDSADRLALESVCSRFRPQVADFADVWNFGRLLFAHPAPSAESDQQIAKFLEYSRICLQLTNPSSLQDSKEDATINKKSSMAYLSQDTAKR